METETLAAEQSVLEPSVDSAAEQQAEFFEPLEQALIALRAEFAKLTTVKLERDEITQQLDEIGAEESERLRSVLRRLAKGAHQ